MARRRFVVCGGLGVQDPESGETVPTGGVVTLEEKDDQTRGFVESGLLELESEHDETEYEMACPLCAEQGKKTVPRFKDWTELGAHYGKAHPGFVVPAWQGEEVSS
jgi:hypothetical protein